MRTSRIQVAIAVSQILIPEMYWECHDPSRWIIGLDENRYAFEMWRQRDIVTQVGRVRLQYGAIGLPWTAGFVSTSISFKITSITDYSIIVVDSINSINTLARLFQ